MSTLCRERVTRQNDFHRNRFSDCARKTKKSACTCDEVSLHFSESEGRTCCGNDHVGRKNYFASACSCESVNSSDDWFVALAINESGKSTTLGSQCLSTSTESLEIGACTEHWRLVPLGVCSQDANPNALFAFKTIYSGLHCLGKIIVDSISRVRTVQCDDRDLAADLVSN